MRRSILAVALVVSVTGCPRPGEEQLRKGNVFFSTGDFDQAAKHYETAATEAPHSVLAREGRGNVAYERGRFDVAESWYRQAIAADPDALGPRHKLAVTQAAGGDVPAAIKTLDEALKIAPTDAYALSFSGGLHRKQGNLAEAERLQLAALQANDEYHAARYALANILIDTGRSREANLQLTRLTTEGREDLAQYGLARLAARDGRPADAARHLEKVLSGAMSHPRAILEDNAFAKVWGDPALAPLHRRLVRSSSAAETSSGHTATSTGT